EQDTFGGPKLAIPPGATYVEDLVLPEWLVLAKEGTYTITATRRARVWDETETAGEFQSTFQLQGLPADPRRLAAVIEELAGDLREPEPEPWRYRAHGRALRALISIPDAAVVPIVAEAIRSSHAPLPRHDTPAGRRVVLEELTR